MKSKILTLILITSLNFIGSNIFSQNLRWSFVVEPTGGSNSVVKIYLRNVSPTTAENINTFGIEFYYNNTFSNATSFDFSPATTNLWPNNGISSAGLANAVTNPLVLISHNSSANINLFDTRIGTPGTSIPANSPPIHVMSINFSNGSPPSLGWLAETDERLGLGYSNVAFDEFPLIVEGPQFAPLPITIKSFEVVKYKNNNAKLNWTTSLEINSDYFGIERSKDGNIWETIGRVTAAGNSSSKLSYEFIDDNLPLIRTKEQVFYYRLRMTDLDAKYKYSDVRGVNFGKSYDGFVTIYPNPTVEHINVDLSGMDLDGGNIDLSVYSMSGQMMIKKNIIGNGIELIDVTQLPASTYNVVVKQGDTLYQQKIIKID